MQIKGVFHLVQNEDLENEDQFDEPTLEDFLPNEEDKILEERHKKRRAFTRKMIAIGLSLALLVSMLQVWPQIFNFSSIKFLQKSAELSEHEEIKAYKEAVVTIQDQNSKGTGFNISKDGFIITNKHVVNDMYPITVSFPNGKIFNGTLMSEDSNLDLALVKIEGDNLPFLPLAEPKSWQASEQIYVIGNPLFHNQIASEGEILQGSSINSVLKISAPIYKGNSGSPVINKSGEVIGVVYAISTIDQTGIAIPIEQVLETLQHQKK